MPASGIFALEREVKQAFIKGIFLTWKNRRAFSPAFFRLITKWGPVRMLHSTDQTNILEFKISLAVIRSKIGRKLRNKILFFLFGMAWSWAANCEDHLENSEFSGLSLRFCSTTPQVQTTLANFADVYLQNKKIFTAYTDKRSIFHFRSRPSTTSRMLYRQICKQGGIKKQCKPFKKELIHFFDQYLTTHSNQDLTTQSIGKTTEDIKQINVKVEQIRKIFVEALNEINDDISKNIFDSAGIKREIDGPDLFNSTVSATISSQAVQDKISSYQNLYLTTALSQNGIILFSKLIRDRIEGNYFDLRMSDLILGAQQIKAELSEELKNLILSHENDPAHFKLQIVLPPHSPNPLEACLPQVQKWFQSSDLFLAKASVEIYPLLQDFSGSDMIALRFLLQKEFQRALWRLKTIGKKTEADALEEWLEQSLMKDELKQDVVALGGGFTSTRQIFYPFSVSAVYKIRPRYSPQLSGTIQFISDFVASHYKREISAYRMDRLIGLNQVPLTKLIFSLDEEGDQEGSAQYFVKGTTSGRQMNDVDPEQPIEPGPFSQRRGRTLPSMNLRFFDWLIDNKDRNLNNFLYLDDGQIILIDHSLSFYTPIFIRPSQTKIEQMIPDKNIFDRVQDLDQNPSLLDQEVGRLLSPLKLRVLKQRIHFFVESVNEMIQKKGVNSVFRDVSP